MPGIDEGRVPERDNGIGMSGFVVKMGALVVAVSRLDHAGRAPALQSAGQSVVKGARRPLDCGARHHSATAMNEPVASQ